MGSEIECRFNRICGNESKGHPTIIIYRILPYGTKGGRHSVGLGY